MTQVRSFCPLTDLGGLAFVHPGQASGELERDLLPSSAGSSSAFSSGTSDCSSGAASGSGSGCGSAATGAWLDLRFELRVDLAMRAIIKQCLEMEPLCVPAFPLI